MDSLTISFPTLSHPKQSEICLRKAIVALLLRPHTATREKEKRKVIEDFQGFPGDRGVLCDMT
jgi:hypothetical protein